MKEEAKLEDQTIDKVAEFHHATCKDPWLDIFSG
jgi:hypothetical protein